ncbi:flagellin [Gluconacetobacter sacchari]|uniref:Flagellin n=2 Tax=Gluconacetobacter sacchari TaxID=92759 RepID=A0A7W4I9C7_9PROT|nr:flagellin [Gluconacetobacter sacchari]MBB2158630.1 flagellin [Gluconacetobacter sacchari]GBQ18830.1 flagellin C protein [Gluconacetobacter sacchari DSM 12717]
MSLSINTNASAKVAIETLNATQSQLSNTENMVSTGLKVSTAADNAAAFGIAQQMQGNVSGQSAVNDGLTFASQTVSSTASAANQILSVLHEVQDAVTSLGNNQGSPASLDQIGTQITGYLNQIDTIARNATFNGVNLLSGSTTDGLGITSSDLTYVTGLQGDSTTITGFNSTIASYLSNASGGLLTNATSFVQGTTGTSLTDALGLTVNSTAGVSPTSNVFESTGGKLGTGFTGTASISDMIAQVQAAIKAMTFVTSTLGSNSNVITNMTTYGATISDNLTNGIGALTDADMSAASAQLTSLQTKQSLAIKSLTIANSQSQNILSLFQ